MTVFCGDKAWISRCQRKQSGKGSSSVNGNRNVTLEFAAYLCGVSENASCQAISEEAATGSCSCSTSLTSSTRRAGENGFFKRRIPGSSMP